MRCFCCPPFSALPGAGVLGRIRPAAKSRDSVFAWNIKTALAETDYKLAHLAELTRFQSSEFLRRAFKLKTGLIRNGYRLRLGFGKRAHALSLQRREWLMNDLSLE